MAADRAAGAQVLSRLRLWSLAAVAQQACSFAVHPAQLLVEAPLLQRLAKMRKGLAEAYWGG